MRPGGNRRRRGFRRLGIRFLRFTVAAIGREIAVRRAPLPPALFTAPPTGRLITDLAGRPRREVPTVRGM